MSFYIALAVVTLITLLPLLVVLPTAPPMWDEAPVAPPHRAGWRISITVARVEAHP